MKSFNISIEKVQVEKNKTLIVVGSLCFIAAIGAIILGVMHPITIPYSLEIFKYSAICLLVAVEWQGICSSSINSTHRSI